MDVVLLWFRCKNPDCDFVPSMTRKQKLSLMKDGKSKMSEKRQRRFMLPIAGVRRYRNNGDRVIFECKYGDIVIYDKESSKFNDAYYPIENKELCGMCVRKIENEKRLFV